MVIRHLIQWSLSEREGTAGGPQLDGDPPGRSPSGPGWLSLWPGNPPEQRLASRGLYSGPPMTVRGAAAQPTPPPTSRTPLPLTWTCQESSGGCPPPSVSQERTKRRGRWWPCPCLRQQQLRQPCLRLSLRAERLQLVPISYHLFLVHRGDLPQRLAQRHHWLRMLQLHHPCSLAWWDKLGANVALSRLQWVLLVQTTHTVLDFGLFYLLKPTKHTHADLGIECCSCVSYCSPAPILLSSSSPGHLSCLFHPRSSTLLHLDGVSD